MWPDRISNPRPLAYESDALLTALRRTYKNSGIRAIDGRLRGLLEATDGGVLQLKEVSSKS